MESIGTPPSDLVVMAQLIQALTANVQELMKQNEKLKRQTRLEGSNTHITNVVVADVTKKLAALKTAREMMLQSTPNSPHMTMIT